MGSAQERCVPSSSGIFDARAIVAFMAKAEEGAQMERETYMQTNPPLLLALLALEEEHQEPRLSLEA
jgi:hypothetical protein